MELVWQTHAWEDYLYWQETDKKILEKINSLIKECLRSPFVGIGKPEPLKGSTPGFGVAELPMNTDSYML